MFRQTGGGGFGQLAAAVIGCKIRDFDCQDDCAVQVVLYLKLVGSAGVLAAVFPYIADILTRIVVDIGDPPRRSKKSTDPGAVSSQF